MEVTKVTNRRETGKDGNECFIKCTLTIRSPIQNFEKKLEGTEDTMIGLVRMRV